jgi:hypothetical protein
VLDPVAGLRPLLAHGKGAEADHDDEQEELDRLARARVLAQVAQRRAPRREEFGDAFHAVESAS